MKAQIVKEPLELVGCINCRRILKLYKADVKNISIVLKGQIVKGWVCATCR